MRCTLRGFGAVRRATVTVKRKGRTVAQEDAPPDRRPACSRSSPRRRCDKGTYKVTIVLRDADGNKRTLKKSFKVK